MTTPQSVPVACMLTPANLAAQAGRWQRLMARAMTKRTETSDGVRLSFRPEPGTEEELRTLVAVETECCAWAAWTVNTGDTRDTGDETIVLDVRSSGDGVATLHGMFRPS